MESSAVSAGFSPTHVIRTERLILRRYLAGMVTDQHISWLNDPHVVKYSEQRHKRHTRESQHRYLNDFPLGSYIWLIKFNSPGEGDIGTITAYLNRENRVADLGILLGEPLVWGRGYGHEAWQAVSRFVFSDEDMRKIEAGCMAINGAMKRLAVKSGMRLEGVKFHHFMHETGPQHLLNYGKFRE